MSADHTVALDGSGTFTSIAQANTHTYAAGDQILFKRGDTFYGTIDLHYQFGESGNPITYGAYGTGDDPIITGFTTISGWTNEGGGIYSKVITAESQTNMVTIDGIQYGMGRYPNTGHLTYESASTNVSITDNQLGESIDWVGAEIALIKNQYALDRCVITNHTGNVLTYTSLGSNQNAAAPESYFIQNDLRTLDQFGEWYHNVSTGKFYMYFGAINPTTKTVKVATLDNLAVAGSGEDFTTIDNIFFTGSIKEALRFYWDNNHFIIQNCTIQFAGLDGIYLAGTNGTISGNTLSDCNRIGIFSQCSTVTISGNTLTNIYFIEGQGNIGDFGKGAIRVLSDNCIIQNNTIKNTCYNGISLSTDVMTAQIKNNYIENTCILLNDQGAIYLDAAKTSYLIYGNIILTSGGNGIYLDEYSTNVKVWNNTVAYCYGAGIKLHKANNNSIRNNTTFDNGNGISLENWLNVHNLYNDSIYDNTFVAKSAEQYVVSYINWYNDNNLGIAFNNYYARPVDDNLTFKTNIMGVAGDKTLAQWQTLTGQDANSKKVSFIVNTESDMYLAYNETNAAKSIPLPFNGKDIDGNYKGSSVYLQPYTSMVVFYSSPTNLSGFNKARILPNGKVTINSRNGYRVMVKE